MRVSRPFIAGAILAFVVATLAIGARAILQGQSNSYTLLTREGRRSVPFRSANNTDLVSLDDLAAIFNLTFAEDTVAGGLTITARGQRIILTPGQSLASVSGRIVSLGGPVVRDGRSWVVPVDFLSRALGPALNTRIEVRRASHLIVMGDVRVPQIMGRLDRQGSDGRLTLELQPAAPRKATLDGNRLIVRFEADALDLGPIAGLSPDFVTGVRVDGTALIVDLNPAVVGLKSEDNDATHSTLDLLTSTSPPPQPTPSQAPPVVEIVRPGIVRTVVIDPGHGGDDEGTHGPGGTKEKDITLQIARRLKAAIESRMGLRVPLTRDGDENVPLDRRAAFANNNKADVLVSLHANASPRPDVRGAQVLSLSLEDYSGRAANVSAAGVNVPVLGGGSRLIEAVPWELAQLPFASHSASLAGIVVQHLTDEHVPLYARPIDQAPLRVLVGAHMPAVLIEVGFLSNAADEKRLNSGELPTAIVNAVVAAIMQVRNGIPTKPVAAPAK